MSPIEALEAPRLRTPYTSKRSPRCLRNRPSPPMHHRMSSILPHRPKTSSAVDDKTTGSTTRLDASMKRTASQTFNLSSNTDERDTGLSLKSLKKGSRVMEYSSSSSTYSHGSSFSQMVSGSYKQICRRLSSSSSRRPSLSESSAPSLKPTKSFDVPHQLLHQDSAFPTIQEKEAGLCGGRFSAFRRLGSIRHRRPAASGPSGETARFNPQPAPIPAGYPTLPLAGSAARAAAAAANNERLNVQRREAELTARFLASGTLPNSDMEDVIKDSESGVGMTCSPPVEQLQAIQEKRLGTYFYSYDGRVNSRLTTADPVEYLPAELSAMVLANLDAPSLATAERVSRTWREAATSPHVWRHLFLRRFEPEVHVSPTPIMMGGAGIGKTLYGRPAPGQDWRQMYKVRKTIDRRWKAGTPNAIYLNGHTDSVYCCQFDE